jgi:hypothetical protein
MTTAPPSEPERHVQVVPLAVAGALGVWFCIWCGRHPVDFPVYWVTVRNLLHHTGPVYGPASGLGWPMFFRYPPFFLAVFAPFATLPMNVAATLWALAKIALLVTVATALVRELETGVRAAGPGGASVSASGFAFTFRGGASATVSGLLLLLPAGYVIQELHYGNVEFFIFGITALALLRAHREPAVSAVALGLAAALKVWPLFFVPLLAARRRLRTAALALAFTAMFTFSPMAALGPRRAWPLLQQWFTQERAVNSGAGEVWYPSQSLQGIMTRYLTQVDYSRVPDRHYPEVNFAGADPETVHLAWLGLAVAGYLALIGLTLFDLTPLGRTGGPIEDYEETILWGVAFCALPLLEPFTHRIVLVLLLWPAIVAAHAVANGLAPPGARRLLTIAAGIAVAEPLVPGHVTQRWFQALGLDFAVACLLLIGLLGILRERLSVRQPAAVPALTQSGGTQAEF